MSPAFQPEIRLLTVMASQLERWRLDDMRAPYWRLYRNREPGMELLLDGEAHPVRPGELVAIPPETPCAGRLSAPVHHTWIQFVARPPFAALPRRIYRWRPPEALLADADELVGLLERGDEREVRVAMLAQLLVTWALCRVPLADLRLDRRDPRIDRALVAIEGDEFGALGNADLARIAGMHPAAFARRFRQITGTTAQAMATAGRIERAANLLVRDQGDIAAVAEATGFCDRAHFSRTFKRLRGMTPGAFRDLMRGQRPGAR